MKRVDHVGASEKFIADEKHIQFHDKRLWELRTSRDAEVHGIFQLGIERIGQAIHTANDGAHVDIRPTEVFAQDLDDGVVHVGLDEVHDRVVLDRFLREATHLEEFVQRVLVVATHDLNPRLFTGRLARRRSVWFG